MLNWGPKTYNLASLVAQRATKPQFVLYKVANPFPTTQEITSM